MAKPLKSSELIASIKRRAMVPNDQRTFTDQQFLDIMNEEIQFFDIPEIMNVHEEYLVTFKDFDIEEGKLRYPIPSRAVGNKLRDIAYITTDSNNPDRPLQYFEMSRISLEELSDYNGGISLDHTDSFYIEGSDVVLVDQLPVSQGSIRMYFYIKPNTLVMDQYAATIQSIDTNTGDIVVSNFQNTFATLPKIDFIASKSPNKIRDYDITPTSVDINTNTITFNITDLPDNLEVGDYINLAGETIVPQLPEELHAIIAQRAAVSALEALGDFEAMARVQNRLDRMVMSSKTLIDNRVEGAPEKIKSRHGAVREAVYGNRGYRRGR